MTTVMFLKWLCNINFQGYPLEILAIGFNTLHLIVYKFSPINVNFAKTAKWLADKCLNKLGTREKKQSTNFPSDNFFQSYICS